MGAPVDNPLPPVDQPLLIEADEHLPHSAAAPLVQGKPLPLPVAGGAQLFQLLHNGAAVELLPLPGALQKALPAQGLLGEALLAHGLHDLCLGGDGGVVGAGHPQGLIPLHPPPADQDILEGLVQGVAHMQLAGDVGRGDDDGIGGLFAVRVRMEIVPIQPKAVGPVLHLAGVINLF